MVPNENAPKISVQVTTYNREDYIVQALESVLMQQTDFAFEIVIGDDYSTDRTRKILQEYAEKFPHKVRLLLHSNHVGLMTNFMTTYQQCRGQYIAFLDSDDYWTDSCKLQKQAEFLDTHPDVVMCAHWVEIIDEEDGEIIQRYNLPSKRGPQVLKLFYTADDILADGLFFHISSAMCRKVFPELPDWLQGLEIENDMVLPLLNDPYGTIVFLDETMGVFRAHKQGICAGEALLTNLKRAKRAFMLIGDNLRISERESFREGFSKFIYLEMCRTYTKQGNLLTAFYYGYKTVITAPPRLRMLLLRNVVSVIIYAMTFSRMTAFFVRLLSVIRLQGTSFLKRCCGESLYLTLKTIYRRMVG